MVLLGLQEFLSSLAKKSIIGIVELSAQDIKDPHVIGWAIFAFCVLLSSFFLGLSLIKTLLFSVIPTIYNFFRRIRDSSAEDDDQNQPDEDGLVEFVGSDESEVDEDEDESGFQSDTSTTSTTSISQIASQLSHPPHHPYRLITIFETLEDSLFEDLCTKVEEIRFTKGDVIFHTGDVDRSIYVVIAGRVRLSISSQKNEEIEVQVIGRGGSVNGWLGAISDLPQLLTARTMCDTRILKLSEQNVENLLITHHNEFMKVIDQSLVRLDRVIFVALHNHLGIPVLMPPPLLSSNPTELITKEEKRQMGWNLLQEILSIELNEKILNQLELSKENSLEIIDLKRGDLIGRGQLDRSFYIVLSGSVEIFSISSHRTSERYLKQQEKIYQTKPLTRNSFVDMPSNTPNLSMFEQPISKIKKVLYKPGSACEEYGRKENIQCTYDVTLSTGHAFGHVSVLTQDDSALRAISSSTPTTLARIPCETMLKLIQINPKALKSFITHLLSTVLPSVRQLESGLQWKTVEAGNVLFRQGDFSDHLYIVLSGRLRESKKSQLKGRNEIVYEKVLRELGRGDTIGELGLVTGHRRHSTARATRDTELAILPRALFHLVTAAHPQLLLQLGASISSKLLQQDDRFVQNSERIERGITSVSFAETRHRNIVTIAALPISSTINISLFCEKLSRALAILGPTLHLSSNYIKTRLGDDALNSLSKFKGSNRIIRWLREQEDKHRYILYESDRVSSAWSSCCVRSADLILLVGSASDMPKRNNFRKQTAEVILKASQKFSEIVGVNPPTGPLPILPDPSLPSVLEMSLLSKLSLTSGVRQALVILHPKTTKRPNNTRAWLKKRKAVQVTYNIKLELDEHVERLARLITGRFVGVALGGGGARGIAHLAVLQALRNKNIPIDMVGGTSIGAFFGVLFASEDGNMDSVIKKGKSASQALGSNWRRILDLTYPFTSIFSGAGFNAQIRTFIHPSLRLEDTWIPFFCTSTNLTESRLMIHKRGVAWKYVRASMTIAGYLPPICDGKVMLVDGGYLNNVPSDIMRNLGADTVIAIDVGSQDDFGTRYVLHGKSLSGWWSLWNSFNPFSSKLIPSMGVISEQLAYVSCVQQLEIAKQCADVYLTPPVQKFGTLAFGKFDEIFRGCLDFADVEVEAITKKFR